MTDRKRKRATGDRQQATGNGSHPEDLRRGADAIEPTQLVEQVIAELDGARRNYGDASAVAMR